MTIAVISWVFKQEIKPSSLKFVLVALADCSDDRGICWPSIDHIAEVTCQDRKTVIKSLDELEARGWLTDTGKRMGRTNQVKVYRIDAYLNAADTKTCGKSAENGTVGKEYRSSAETVPFFPVKSTENGKSPTPPYIDDPSTEPSINPSAVDRSSEVKQVFAWLENFLNSSSPLFSSPISAWLSWGANLELDIKPVAERWLKANPQKAIRSLEWLDNDIAASIRKRTKPMPEETTSLKGTPHGNSARYANSGRGYSSGGRQTKSDAADEALHTALTDLGLN